MVSVCMIRTHAVPAGADLNPQTPRMRAAGPLNPASASRHRRHDCRYCCICKQTKTMWINKRYLEIILDLNYDLLSLLFYLCVDLNLISNA